MAPPVAEKQTGYASKVSCRKRMECLKKKARELSVLCGTDACLLILWRDGKNETWPENSSDVMSIICRAKSCDPKKKALSSPNSRFALRSVGSSSSIDCDDSWLDGLSPESLCSFRESLLEKMKAAKNRAESLAVINEQETWEVCAEIISLDDGESSESAQTVSGGTCFNAINIGGCAEIFQPSADRWPISDCAASSSQHFQPSSPSGWYQVAAEEQVAPGTAEPFVQPNNGGFDQSWPSFLFDV